MARISSLRGWVSIIAAVSLVLTATALIIALAAAANARASSRELSQRLVPAAAAAGVLLSQYTAQQTALRDYVSGGRAATLAPFTQSAAQIPGEQTRLAALVRGYPRMDGHLAALVRVIRPDLPVLYMSGYAQEVLDAQGALNAGVDLLEKPFSQATMLIRVRQAIDNGGQPAAPAPAASAPVPAAAGRASSGPRV